MLVTPEWSDAERWDKIDRSSGSVGQPCSYPLAIQRSADLIGEGERLRGIAGGVGEAVVRLCRPHGHDAGVSRNGVCRCRRATRH
jgi:hypothetical protein